MRCIVRMDGEGIVVRNEEKQRGCYIFLRVCSFSFCFIGRQSILKRKRMHPVRSVFYKRFAIYLLINAFSFISPQN